MFMVTSTCVRGCTLARLAAALVLFSLRNTPALQLWQSCGKPSTKFPHGGLVECLFVLTFAIFLFSKLKNFHIFSRFLGNSYFSKFPKIFGYHQSGRGIMFFTF